MITRHITSYVLRRKVTQQSNPTKDSLCPTWKRSLVLSLIKFQNEYEYFDGPNKTGPKSMASMKEAAKNQDLKGLENNAATQLGLQESTVSFQQVKHRLHELAYALQGSHLTRLHWWDRVSYLLRLALILGMQILEFLILD